jgi:hypothetical protein
MKPFVLILFLLIFINVNAQKPKGNRVLAWQIDKAENDNYDSAFSYAKTACMESIHLSINWSSLDTNNGKYDQNFIANI